MKTNKKGTEDDWEGFDDCEICKLMKKGEYNYGDLAEAFAKQNTQNKLRDEKSKGDKK